MPRYLEAGRAGEGGCLECCVEYWQRVAEYPELAWGAEQVGRPAE